MKELIEIVIVMSILQGIEYKNIYIVNIISETFSY